MSRNISIQVGEFWQGSTTDRYIFFARLPYLGYHPGVLLFGHSTCGMSQRLRTESINSAAYYDYDFPLIRLGRCRSDLKNRQRAIKELKNRGAEHIVGIYMEPPISKIEKMIALKKEQLDLAVEWRTHRKTDKEVERDLMYFKTELKYAKRLIANPPTAAEGFDLLVTAEWDGKY